jgi:hypothetical protein
MKIEKQFELLNSEGPIVSILKIDGLWHYKFHKSPFYTVTTPKDILNAIWNDQLIYDSHNSKFYRLSEHPLSMKGDNPKYYAGIVEHLLREELEKSIKDPEHFRNTYMRQ